MKRGWKLKEAGFTIATGKGSRSFLRFCVLTLDPNILNVNAYFMTELWEWGRGKGSESKRTCAFWGAHTETQQCYRQRNLCLAFCTLCDCVHVWVHMIIHFCVAGVCMCGRASNSALRMHFFIQLSDTSAASHRCNCGQQHVSWWSAW